MMGFVFVAGVGIVVATVFFSVVVGKDELSFSFPSRLDLLDLL